MSESLREKGVGDWERCRKRKRERRGERCDRTTEWNEWRKFLCWHTQTNWPNHHATASLIGLSKSSLIIAKPDTSGLTAGLQINRWDCLGNNFVYSPVIVSRGACPCFTNKQCSLKASALIGYFLLSYKVYPGLVKGGKWSTVADVTVLTRRERTGRSHRTVIVWHIHMPPYQQAGGKEHLCLSHERWAGTQGGGLCEAGYCYMIPEGGYQSHSSQDT